ncbi:rho-type GTPase-activating protein 1 [Monosporozyma servazzii]
MMQLQSPRSIPPPLPTDIPNDNIIHDHMSQEGLPDCVRCKEAITSGQAYELGDDRWHTHCFTCYRCEKSLSCDSDFLVLGTGALICFDCSDSCKNCGKKIDDLAIILSSSNEAYCSDCFVCCKCGDNIKDLRYARTRKGLFCLKCHKKLLAKRKYYEEKKRREKKHLPIPPEISNDDPVLNDINDFNPDSPMPEIQERSPAKMLTSPVRKISMHSPLPNDSSDISHKSETNYLASPVPKKLLNKTPLKNYDGKIQQTNDDFNSSANKNHRKELSLPLFNSEQSQTLAPAQLIGKQDSLKNSHLKTKSDLTGSTRQSPLIEKDTYTHNEKSKEFLNIPSTTTYDNLAGQLSTPQRFVNEDTASSKDDDLDDYHNITDTAKKELEYSTINDTQNENTSMSTNDILNNYMDKSSLVNDNETSLLSTKLRSDNILTDSNVILKQLQEDISTLQMSKAELMHSIDDMILLKSGLEKQLHSLREEIKNNRQMLIEKTQQPQMFVTSSDSYSSENSPVRNISTASIARPATKPKFWKFFSSKQQNSPSMGSSPIKASHSNQNIHNLRNMQAPVSFTNPNGRSSLPHSPSASSVSKLEISHPRIQNPDDFKDVNLIPISSPSNSQLPVILTECIKYIESDEENLKSEGLYRKSGSKRVIDDIEAQFNSGKEDIDLSLYDINAVTGVLKKYLRNLPNPIITYELYAPIIDYVRQHNLNLSDPAAHQGFMNILNLLPREHIEVLKLLGEHISLVQRYSDENLMTTKNLCLVFTPSLIMDYSGENDIIDMRERNFVISYILENYREILP